MRLAESNELAENLPQLMAQYDQAFVRCAYLALLGRTADPDGLSTYTRQIRSGERKIAVVSQLYLSDEGRAYAAKLPGLSKAVAEYRHSRLPLIGALLLIGRQAEGDSAPERRLRSIENAVHAKGNELLYRLDRLEAMVASRAASPSGPAAVSPLVQEPTIRVVSPATPKPAKGGFVPG